MTTKKEYLSPEIEIVAMETQSFIAVSNPSLTGGGEGDSNDYTEIKQHNYSVWDE